MPINNFTITIANTNNQSIILEGSRPQNFGLTAVDGLEATGYTQNININSNFPGGTLAGTQISPRQININFNLIKNDREQENRLYLERFFKPTQEFDVIVTRQSVTRHIKCYLQKLTIKQTHLYATQYVTLSLVAPNPFFMDMSDYGRDIASVTGMFAPPFLMNATTGQIMGTIKNENLTTIENGGDMEVGLTARFVAKDTVHNIKLYNARSETDYVRVIDIMTAGNIITISTMDGHKRITKTAAGIDSNIINKLDRSSNFFKIKPGVNVIGFEADEGANVLEVWLHYTPLYYGI